MLFLQWKYLIHENYLLSRFSNMRLVAQQFSTFELLSLLELTRSHHTVPAKAYGSWTLL